MKPVTLASALGSGLVAGVFFAFSAFVMLEKVAPGSASAAHEWSHYMATWMPWNHVRGLASLAAAALLTVAFASE